jgi:hypothetical protein
MIVNLGRPLSFNYKQSAKQEGEIYWNNNNNNNKLYI